MAILPRSTATNPPTLQAVANSVRSMPELAPLLGSSGWTQEPAISIANDVMQRIFAQGMNWKWNSANIPAILTVSLQQDYVTNVEDIGWLESSTRIDVNNTAQPKPWFQMEAVRQVPRTSLQFNPFQVCWIPNSLAVMGQWQPNTLYPCAYGGGQMQPTPIQQFVDENGNILFIDSTVLKLGPYSPGTGQTLPDFGAAWPYGTSGSTQPYAPPDSPGGTTVQDGTVIWTVASPYWYAIRCNTLPPNGGIAWLLNPVYQKKPPIFTSLQQTIDPVPADHAYLFRTGFLAYAQDYAGSNKAQATYARFEEMMMTALRGADREMEECFIYPSDAITSGYGAAPAPIGPAWPFGW